MYLGRLKYFLAVAEERHFGRAAERLFMTQPPLTQQIKLLEKELDTKLFERTSRSVKLTQAGELLYAETRPLLAKLEKAAEQARLAAQGLAGSVEMAFVSTFMDTTFPNALSHFRQERPLVKLVLREYGTQKQLEMLRRGELDLGLVRLLETPYPGFTARLYHCEPYVMAIPQNNPLAGMERVPLKALKDEPLVLFPKRSHPMLHESMLHCLRKAGVQPNIIQEATHKYTTTALVGAGMGIGFTPRSMRLVRRPGVVYRDIDGELPLVRLYAMYKSNSMFPALQAFLEHLEKYGDGGPFGARQVPGVPETLGE